MTVRPTDPAFASDNTAGLAPEALAALVAANAGAAPSYGEDPWTRRARGLIADFFEHEAEVFFVFNGTAANSLALAQYCRSYQSVLCHERAHVETDECAAPEFFLGGGKIVPIASPGAKLRPGDVRPVFGRGHGVHYPPPGALSLSQATEWGTLYTPGEVAELAELAHAHGCAVHLDGARFSNAAAAFASRGVRPADLTWRAGVDVVCLGGTKGGMAGTEAVIFFRREDARGFEYRVKQGGQLASKQRIAAAQWCGMLDDGAWLRHAAHANAQARRLAEGIRSIPGVHLLHEAEANGVFVDLPDRVAADLGERGWLFHRFIGERGYRLMCSWATTPESVDRLLADLRAAAAGA